MRLVISSVGVEGQGKVERGEEEENRRNKQTTRCCLVLVYLPFLQPKYQTTLRFCSTQMRYHYATNYNRKLSGAHYLLPGPVWIQRPSMTCTDKCDCVPR
jgi:hypothetical protein